MGEQGVHKPKTRDHDDVNFGVTKKPKQMLEEDSIPSSGKIKDGGVEMPIREEEKDTDEEGRIG